MFSPFFSRSFHIFSAIHCHPLPHVPRSGGVDEGETARDLCPLCPLCPCRPCAFGKVSKRLGQLERHMPRPLQTSLRTHAQCGLRVPHCGVGVELFGLGMAWQRCHSCFPMLWSCSFSEPNLRWAATVGWKWPQCACQLPRDLDMERLWKLWKMFLFFLWRIEANNLFLRCARDVNQGFETWFDQISCTVQARCSSQERSGSMPRDKAWFSAIGISVRLIWGKTL